MKDVWTTSINEETLDEAPMAYKSIDDIIKHIDPTVEILDVIRPIYNYKAY
jgi:RNA-splicing ligase RtcB